MKIKKILAVLASISLCSCLFGCNSNEEESSKENSVVETTEQETAENSLQADYNKLKADYDSLVSENNSLKQEISELKNTPTEAPTESSTEKEETDEILYEDETLRITYKGTEKSIRRNETNVKLTIENLSDIGIEVQVRDTSVNGIMVDPIFSCSIAAGKKANDELSFYALENEGIDKIETIEFCFHVFTAEGWDNIVDTDPIILDFS